VRFLHDPHHRNGSHQNAVLVGRQRQSLDTCAELIEDFEAYLRNTAISLQAKVIAEENSNYLVLQMMGGLSVAKKVAEELGVRHVYCDPRGARHAR
jgi:hypothetical protein